jgi:hypothetical protein
MQIAPVKKEQRGPMLLLADVSRGASATLVVTAQLTHNKTR